MICRALAIALVILVATAGSALSKDSAKPGWHLTQTHRTRTFEVYICSDALKVSAADLGWNAVARAPDWTVHTYNTKLKLYFDIIYKEWLGTGFPDFHTDRVVYEKRGPMKVLSQRLNKQDGFNQRVITFKANGELLDGRKWHETMTYDRSIENTKGAGKADRYVCVFDERVSHPRVSQILESLYNMPKGPDGMIPVRYICILTNGNKFLRLNTTKIEPCTVSEKIFELPKTYKRAKVPTNVTAGKNPEECDDILNDLGVGLPFGSAEPGKAAKKKQK